MVCKNVDQLNVLKWIPKEVLLYSSIIYFMHKYFAMVNMSVDL